MEPRSSGIRDIVRAPPGFRFASSGLLARTWSRLRSPDGTAQQWNPGRRAGASPDSASLHRGLLTDAGMTDGLLSRISALHFRHPGERRGPATHRDSKALG